MEGTKIFVFLCIAITYAKISRNDKTVLAAAISEVVKGFARRSQKFELIVIENEKSQEL